MAEGMIGGILGEDDEKPEIGATESLAAAEAFAAAVAAKLAGSDPEVARDTSALLKQQARLLKIQTEHLKDEHEARLRYLRGQAREVDIRRFGLRMRVGFQLFLVLAATAIGVGAAVMIHDAVTSRQVVIEPFDLSPNVAARVPSGKIIAAGVLDELSRLQDATRSSIAARGLAGAWANNLKLEVPEAGVSIGEVSRLLEARFGHDVHIDGDLTEAPTGGLELTVRGNGVPPKTFSGPATGLDRLTVDAAEYVYSKSQPERWAAYLIDQNRFAEAIAFSRYAVASALPEERGGLLSRWALALESSGGSVREALALYRAAIKLQPELWNAHSDIQNDLMILGDEEGAWKAGEQMRSAAGGRPGRAAERNYTNWDYLTSNLLPWLTGLVADADANAGVGTLATSVGPSIADIEVRLHDPEAADLSLKTTKEDPRDIGGVALAHHVRGRLAAEAGDTDLALAEMEAFAKTYADPAVSTNYPGYHCWVAPAEAAAGHPDKADAFLKTAGTYVDCYRFRADILDGRGDWPGAQKAYAEAVALAPDLPAAYFSWGVALAKHDDVANAEAKFEAANRRGPHWADPLKAWGDVLVKQRKVREARAKYDEALRFAPNWRQLKDAREALAKQ